MKLTYRPEIDGLRGVAIIFIILSHFKQLNIVGGGVNIFFVIIITGIIPAITIMIAEVDASAILSSDANSKALIDKVLKLNGLKIVVSGSSFKTSIKTTKKLINKGVFSKWKWILKNIDKLFAPRDFAASSVAKLTDSKPALIVLDETVKNLIQYAKIKIKIVPLNNKPTEIPK